ncbi:FAD/NAD(P)-binding protein [Candidatus Fermentibacteria bacterium]|nr:FAD/NAD(P)-binding protein [Candidatus Fermentibacteria bacterium]
MTLHANPYEPIAARLAEVVDETPTIKTFIFTPDEPIPFVSGQFVQLCLPGIGEAPFTPSSSPREPNRIEITILRTGAVTEALHRLEPGAELGIRGPLGKGYPVDELEGKDILVVGGGVGLAPLRALLYHLFHIRDQVGKIEIKYGARSPEELLFRRQYGQWSVLPGVRFSATVDVPHPQWTGRTGVVTVLLDDIQLDLKSCLVFSCGPGVMFKFVVQKLLELGARPEQIYLSMNRRMSCGIGKCGRCNIGPYYLCKDGPDMNYAKIMGYADVF